MLQALAINVPVAWPTHSIVTTTTHKACTHVHRFLDLGQGCQLPELLCSDVHPCCCCITYGVVFRCAIAHMPLYCQHTLPCFCSTEILEAPGTSHLVITHKSMARAFLCTALALPPTSFRSLDMNNGGVSIFRYAMHPAAHHHVVFPLMQHMLQLRQLSCSAT